MSLVHKCNYLVKKDKRLVHKRDFCEEYVFWKRAVMMLFLFSRHCR